MCNAKWIWYPGDYELNIASEILFRRDARGVIEPPFWKIDSIFRNVVFVKNIDIVSPIKIHIISDSEISVATGVSGTVYPSSDSSYLLPQGSYELSVVAYSQSSLPSIYIDSDFVKTDASWFAMVDRYRGQRYPVGFSDTLTAKDKPSKFKFCLTEIFPISKEKLNGLIVYDFGKETFGYIKAVSKSAKEVTFYYGESKEEALDVNECEVFDRISLFKGETTHTHSRGFRFVAVDENAELESVSLMYEYLPLERQGAFSCSDSKINKIYDTAYYTLHLNSRETFLDGLKRDRWYWGGDAYQSYLYNFYTFFDREINHRTMWALRGKDPVTLHVNHIMDYTFYWFISLYDHYMHMGDEEFLRSIYDSAVKLMEFCLGRTDENGFMKSLENDWVFLDWAALDNSGIVCAEQILFWQALNCMGKIADLFADLPNCAKYTKLAKSLKDNIFKVFYNEKDGTFAHNFKDGQLGKTVTRYANIFAINYGMLNYEQIQKSVVNVLKNDDIQQIVTPYAKFYELVALCESKQTEEFKNTLISYWGGMLDLGATTFWELYNPTDTNHLGMYGRKYGKSLCHAWGSCPVYLLGRYFLGVKPTKPAYRSFSVQPSLGGLDYIKGDVPTPTGKISVYMNKESVTVENDTEYSGVLYIEEHRLKNADTKDGYTPLKIRAKSKLTV